MKYLSHAAYDEKKEVWPLATGYLSTRIYTTRIELPVSNATVSVVAKNSEDKYTLVGVRISDQNGKTSAIPIETPALVDSLTPDVSPAYALVDIWVEHPNYKLMEIRDVQIFPDVESVQEIALLPLTRSQIDFSGTTQIRLGQQEE